VTINEYVEREFVRVTNAFTNAGTLYDPTNVWLVIRKPNGVETTYQYLGVGSPIVKDSTGNYHADLDTTGFAGYWDYKWYSTGTGPAAAQDTFYVKGIGET